MTDIHLSPEQKAALEKRHRTERDGRVKDRMKAVLLRVKNWTLENTLQALRVHVDKGSVRIWLIILRKTSLNQKMVDQKVI